MSKSKTVSGANALLSLAKKTTKTAAAKSADKKTIKVTDKTIVDAIDSYIDGKRKLQEGKAQVDAAGAIINPFAQTFHIEEIEKNHRDGYKFAHLNASKDDGGRAEEFVADLRSKFGEEIVETTNDFSINPEKVQEYAPILTAFIQYNELVIDTLKEALAKDIKNVEAEIKTAKKDKNKDLVDELTAKLDGMTGQLTSMTVISDEDKGEIIQLKQSNKIAKGTINKLAEIAKNAKMTVKEVWAYIMPTQQLKARGEK